MVICIANRIDLDLSEDSRVYNYSDWSSRWQLIRDVCEKWCTCS
jgi:hypothetical protein